jgi:hypothetical protein
MPAPSALATRLAEDLVHIGNSLGFETRKEAPIQEGSNFKIDVFWRLKMPEGCLFDTVSVASIEIQYSDAPHSVTHNIFKVEKTLHPAIHVVISYNELTQDYIDNVLKTNFPREGLVIINGPKDFVKLNMWITRFLAIEKDEERLKETRESIRKFASDNFDKYETEEDIEEQILQTFKPELEEVFLPPEINSLLETFVEINSKDKKYQRNIIDEIFWSFIELVQTQMKKYNIPRIYISHYFLFSGLKIEQPFADMSVKLGGDIEIEQDAVIFRDSNDYPLAVEVKNGIAYVNAPAGVVCREGLRATDIIYFIRKASEEIEKEIKKYGISEDDKKVLEAILNSLN